MIARMFIGLGLKTYMASGSMILYVKKGKNALRIKAKKLERKEETRPAPKNVALHTNNA